MKLPIGTRITFTKTLDEAASGDSPARVYADKGQHGTIVGHNAREGYMVKADGYGSEFGASRDEFEVKV